VSMVDEERQIGSCKGAGVIDRLRQVDRMAWLLLFLRVCLGGLFITSSIGKFQYPELFIDAVKSYDILPVALAELFGKVLPWVELFIGCSLILGIFSTFAAGIAAALALSFIIANIYSLFHPGVMACGCLGRLVTLSHGAALAIDFAMLATAGVLLYYRDKAGYLGLGRLLGKGKDIPGLPGSAKLVIGVATIVVAMIVAASLISVPTDSLDADIDNALEDYEAVAVFFAAENPAGYEIIADLETQYQSVRFLRVYFGDDPQAVRDFNIETFPTVLVITAENRDGIVLAGPVDKDVLTASIEQVLSSNP
jgi:uncharacterized membrane protein YphA (DoxX/SURF4 family)